MEGGDVFQQGPTKQNQSQEKLKNGKDHKREEYSHEKMRDDNPELAGSQEKSHTSHEAEKKRDLLLHTNDNEEKTRQKIKNFSLLPCEFSICC